MKNPAGRATWLDRQNWGGPFRRTRSVAVFVVMIAVFRVTVAVVQVVEVVVVRDGLVAAVDAVNVIGVVVFMLLVGSLRAGHGRSFLLRSEA